MLRRGHGRGQQVDDAGGLDADSWRGELSRAGAANDVGVASNPEFLREGNAVRDFLQPSRVVIGCDDAAVAVRVSELYRDVQAPILVTDPASAEMIKYASNAFLATKISFINAIANLCEAVNADVREVSLGMGYDPRIGFEFLHPGPGLRRFVLPEGHRRAASTPPTTAGYDFSLLRGVVDVNRRQHERMVEKLRDAAGGSLRGRHRRRVGPHVQGQHRRPPRLAGAGRCAARLLEEGAIGPGVRPRRGRGRRGAGPRRSRSSPTRTRRRPAPGVLALLTEWDEFRWLDFDRVADAMDRAARPGRRPEPARSRGDAPPRVRLPGRRPLMPRAVVTGGAGFVGSHLCDALRGARLGGRRGRQLPRPVTATNVAHLRRRRRLHPGRARRHRRHPRRRTGRRGAAPRQPGEPARVPRPPDRDARGRRRSAPGTRSTSRARHGARFLLASTSEIYGDPLVHPQPESYFGNVNSVGPAVGVRRGEALRRGDHDGVPPRRYGVDTKIVRIFNTYGPRLRRRPTGGSCRTSSRRRCAGEPLTVYGDGKQTRSFCYVDDEVRRAARAARLRPRRPDEHRQPRRVHHARARRARARGHRCVRRPIVFEPLPADDPKQRRPDISLAEEVLGWHPTVDLREGLARTYDWYRRHGGTTLKRRGDGSGSSR